MISSGQGSVGVGAGAAPVAQGQSSGKASTDASDRGVAQSILNNEQSAKWIEANTDPRTGGLSASATHITRSAGELIRTIACQGTRLSGEQILSTGLMLNGSICRACLAIIRDNTQNRDQIKLGTDGASGIHKLKSACASLHSLLASIHDLEAGTRDGISDRRPLFGENVSSAQLWLLIPETSALLLVAACEILYHGVESGSLSVGALSEFEPFCAEACQIISRCCKDSGSMWQQSYKEMVAMIKDHKNSIAEKLPGRPSIATSMGNADTRHSTHSTLAVSLFSAPLSLSKLAMITQLKSFEGSTLASQRCRQLCTEIAAIERQAGVEGWPETGSFGRMSSFCNTLRQLIARLADERIDLPDHRNKQTMGSSGFATSNTALCLSVMLSELLVMRSTWARLSEAPRTARDTKAYSALTVEGSDSKKTVSAGESKDGSSQTDATDNASRDGIRKAADHTQHDRKKADSALVSADSELPIMGKTGTTATKSALTLATSTQSINNSVTKSLYAASQSTRSIPLELTTAPFREMVAIVKEVCKDQERPQYASVCNGLSKLTMQFEEVQMRLMGGSTGAGAVKSTYSATLSTLMEPTALASLSVRTLSQLCKHFDKIKESLAHCSAELRAETDFQSVETGNRTNSKRSATTNVVETTSQSMANTSDVTQRELRRARDGTDRRPLMQHEASLSVVETALSIAGSEVSKVLSLLAANSGQTLHQTERKKYESNIKTMECEASSGENLSGTTQEPEARLCDNNTCGGVGASTNTTVLTSVAASATVLKLFETVHSLGSAVSEALLQSLIFATHPIDQTFAAIEAWKNKPWVRETHSIGDDSRSVSSDQQTRITTDVAKMVRNILCVFCITSGSSNREELVVVPAPVALRNILNAFGKEDDPRPQAGTTEVLSEMRELTFQREETLYKEMGVALNGIQGRRAVGTETTEMMVETRRWIATLQSRQAARAEPFPAFETMLRGYLLHLIHMVEERRWSSVGAKRTLTDVEMEALCDLLLTPPPPPPVVEAAPVVEESASNSELERVEL